MHRTLLATTAAALALLAGCATPTPPGWEPPIEGMNEASVEVAELGTPEQRLAVASRVCGLSGRKAVPVGKKCGNEVTTSMFTTACYSQRVVFACMAGDAPVASAAPAR